MKYTIRLLTAVLFLFFIVSCEKSNQDPVDPPTPPEKASKLISYRRYSQGRSDTFTHKLIYDQKERLTKIRIYKNGIDVSYDDTITYTGNLIIYKKISNIPVNTGIYIDSIEVDNYKMPTKRTVNWTKKQTTADEESNLFRHSVSYYSYSPNGSFAGELNYLTDSNYNISNGQVWTSKRIDTSEVHCVMENDNIKTVERNVRQGSWHWQNGTADFSNNSHTFYYDYSYSKNYASPPVNEFNYLSFIHEYYSPYKFFSTRNNFTKIPDRVVTRLPYMPEDVEDLIVSYTDKGYISKVEHIFDSGKEIWEYTYQ